LVYHFIYQSIFVTICGRLRISISENWIIRALSGCFEIQVVKNHELVGKKRKNSLNRVRRNEKPSFDRRGFLFVRAFECGRLVRSCFVSFSFCFFLNVRIFWRHRRRFLFSFRRLRRRRHLLRAECRRKRTIGRKKRTKETDERKESETRRWSRRTPFEDKISRELRRLLRVFFSSFVCLFFFKWNLPGSRCFVVGWILPGKCRLNRTTAVVTSSTLFLA